MKDPDFLRTIKKIVIAAIFSDADLFDILVLKGGNLLDVAYELSGRSSVDVDFSMDRELSNDSELQQRVCNAVTNHFANHGYFVFDFNFRNVPPKLSEEMKDFWGGYKIDFKIIETENFVQFANDLEYLRRNALKVGKNESTKFRIDISRHEYCDEKENFEVNGQKIYGYSPKVFAAEKLRAICQQMDEYAGVVMSNPSPRARDFVDIYIIVSHYGISWADADFQRIVKAVFGKKHVPTSLVYKINETFDFHFAGFESVQATVLPGYDLQDFEFYFSFVCKHSEDLKSLGDE